MSILRVRDENGNYINIPAIKGEKGDTGAKGLQGEKGADGYTPVKGVDYFDGVDGTDGYTPVKGKDYFDGKDGYTPVKGVDYFDGKDGEDGVSVTARVISGSTISGAANVIRFFTAEGDTDLTVYNGEAGKDGKDGVNGKDGEDGKDGVDGYTPVKGVDYYTEAEKNELVQEIVSEASGRGVGEDVSGDEFVVNGATVIANYGAERFNDYLNNVATGQNSHAEGYETTASGYAAHAEGFGTTASGSSTHAEGIRTTASGSCAHAEGYETTASGSNAHAEGRSTIASGSDSHAEGGDSTADNDSAHAEGRSTIASGYAAHAEGNKAVASGFVSHAEGNGTIAAGSNQHVQGTHNIVDEDVQGKYAHIVGNGTDEENRSNAHTLDWDGNAWYAGDVYVGSSNGKDKDSGSKKLATEEYVNSVAVGGGGGVSSWNDLTDKPFGEDADGTIHPIDGKYLPEGTPWVGKGVVELLTLTMATSFTHPAFGTMWRIDAAVDLKVGKTYTINYNGVGYVCTCQAAPAGLIDDPDAVAMGNFSVVGGANTGEPFAMLASLSFEEIDIIDLVGSSSVAISILGEGEAAHKLDNRCLDLDWLPTANKVRKELVAETTFDSLQTNAKLTSSTLRDVKSVIVVCDGVEYRCEVQRGSGNATGESIGNKSLISPVHYPNTGEPFLIATASDFTMCIPDSIKSSTVSIFATEIFNRMPARYLPDDAKELILVSPGGTRYRIAVSDLGTLDVDKADV